MFSATMQPPRAVRGTALIFGMICLVLMFGLAVAVHTLSQGSNVQAKMYTDDMLLFVAAESALDAGEQRINSSVANWEDPDDAFASTYNDVQVSTELQHVDNLDYVRTDADGIQTSVQVWKLSATAEKEISAAGDVASKTVERSILVAITPLFQFVTFYNNDLEINPGPDMTLTGRIHTNSDLYLGAGNNLWFNSNYIRAVGGIYRARKDDWSRSTGNVYIRNKETDDYVLMENRSQFDPPNGDESGFDSNYAGYDENGDGDFLDANDWLNWTLGAIDRWGGTVQSNVHETEVWESPEVKTTEQLVSKPGGAYDEHDNYVGSGNGDYDRGFYYETAELIIKDDRAYDKDGNDVTGTLPADTITEKTMYDAREGKTITVTEVDMQKLSQSGAWPANGLVYATRTDMTTQEEVGSSYQPNGVRLANGEQLAGPLTLVSNCPVYVKGDYNTGVAEGEMGDGYTGAYGKQPAAVITDAINLLSNSWDDTKGPGDGLSDATETTFNMAVVTGNQVTEFNGAYNGGFENLPRFHEDWSGVNAIIRGSFVNLWQSKVGVGDWSYGSPRYTAPNRDWDFDSDFLDADNLPPYTPRAVGTESRVQWEL
jgi:Tfp pilus assembly protein PilX